jgi:hypothetical protein
MTLPDNIDRCRGFGDGPEDWLDECHACQRRTSPGGLYFMKPPAIIAFFCEFIIPEDTNDSIRLAAARQAYLGSDAALPYGRTTHDSNP